MSAWYPRVSFNSQRVNIMEHIQMFGSGLRHVATYVIRQQSHVNSLVPNPFSKYCLVLLGIHTPSEIYRNLMNL